MKYMATPTKDAPKKKNIAVRIPLENPNKPSPVTDKKNVELLISAKMMLPRIILLT